MEIRYTAMYEQFSEVISNCTFSKYLFELLMHRMAVRSAAANSLTWSPLLNKLWEKIIQQIFNFITGQTKFYAWNLKHTPILRDLGDGSATVIPVLIESCHELSLTPCSQNPDDFFMIKRLILGSVLENISLWFRQSCINFRTVVSKHTHQGNQKLQGKGKKRLIGL